jgi:hypothetical protein
MNVGMGSSLAHFVAAAVGRSLCAYGRQETKYGISITALGNLVHSFWDENRDYVALTRSSVDRDFE